MQTNTQTAETSYVEILRREIARFMRAARQRCETDVNHRRRRSLRRYHRSWPLLVSGSPDQQGADRSVALYNASDGGIAFLSRSAYQPGDTIFIKHFWHEDDALRVPAVVRHATPREGAFIIGCEYALENQRACVRALDAVPRWYD